MTQELVKIAQYILIPNTKILFKRSRAGSFSMPARTVLRDDVMGTSF